MTICAHAQSAPNERAFPQSRAAVEKVLKTLQASLSGRLPALEGFAEAGDHPLDRYQRGFYQSTVEVTAASSGGSLVRVHTKVTAWYADPVAAKSGYQLLTSNGRLESDLLDQLADQLSKTAAEPTRSNPPVAKSNSPASSSSTAKAPASTTTFPSLTASLAEQERSSRLAASSKGLSDADKANQALEAEAHNLEEILKNQAHPRNLVAVKKSGTPVVESPSLAAKPLFMASAHDEFEMLDFTADWVHVRISGLSRGWIWRNSLEMPEGIPDTPGSASPQLTPAADLFHVAREETAPFPGDWAPLRGRNVKIISVQKVEDAAKDPGSRERMEYSKFLFEKNYSEMGAAKTQDLAGIVLIFDSSDGGMVAATVASLQQWKAGKLSDSAFWHQCFFDPPETFDATGSP